MSDEPAVADVVDVRRLLGEDRRRVERRPHGDHELEPLGDRGERRGGGPRVERRRVDALDVVQEQLGDEREVVADLLAALGEAAARTPTSPPSPRRRRCAASRRRREASSRISW